MAIPTTMPVVGPIDAVLFGAQLTVPKGPFLVDTAVPQGPYVEVAAALPGGQLLAMRCGVVTAPRGGTTIAPPSFLVTASIIPAAVPFAPPELKISEALHFQGPVRGQRQ